MSCFKLPLNLLIIIAVLLSNCGFQPALKKNVTSFPEMGQFEVSVTGGRASFFLEELISQRLGLNNGATKYQLNAELDVSERDEAVPNAGGINRKLLQGEMTYVIWSAAATEIIADGIVSGSASYSGGGGNVASEAARLDAEKRMLTQIADRLYSQLIVTANGWT